jgi:apolipoprotein N-acyltransferase
VPLLFALKSASGWKSAFWLGYITGVVYFFGLLHWLILLYPFANIFVTAFAGVGLAAFLGVYIGGFATLLHSIPRQSGVLYIFAAATIWTGLEWLRGWLLTGCPWGNLGHSQWNNLPAIQIASITAVYGVSFMIVLLNAALATLIRAYPDWQGQVKAVILTIAIVIASFTYGIYCLSDADETPTDATTLKLALVPGNIPQLEKWQAKNLSRIIDHYIQVTKQANESRPDLTVWPETALPRAVLSGRPNRYSLKLYQTLREQQIYLLTGVPHQAPDSNFYNSAFLLSPSGDRLGSYSKIHLVPFGEYVPLSRYLPNFIQFVPFHPGTSTELMPLPTVENTQIGISICFESVFPNLFRKSVKKGANMMGILTNDAWFEGTPAPEQHFSAAPFRAVENGVPVFRCANGGISCIIDASGRVITPKILPDNTSGFLIGEATLSRQKQTIYTRYGDWFPILCFLVSATVVIYYQRGFFAKSNRQSS